MKKRFVLKLAIVVFIVFFFFALVFVPGEDIPNSKIPARCIEQKDDICALYDCMMDVPCWCDESNFPSPVLFDSNSSINNEEQAIAVVADYLEGIGSDYSDVRRAVSSDEVFFNVFAYDSEENEKVFTVSLNGIIFLTMCGV